MNRTRKRKYNDVIDTCNDVIYRCINNIKEHNVNYSTNSSTFFVVVIVVFTFSQFVSSSNFNTGCKMSEKWWGKYYQSGLGHVIIGETHVTTKGICINQTKDFYVFYNRDEDCFYCLVMLKMHKNIIQYRESHCVKSKLQNICSHVHLETPMHTLVRENADSIKCPLNGLYFFNINDPLREPCPNMDSIAKPCVGRTRYQMVLRSCHHGFKVHTGDLHMECIGIWKEGSDSYLYVRISMNGYRELDDTHRCLRYQGNDLEIRAAMSADATCQGLKSSSDGPYVLRLLRNNTSMLDESCQFPDWLDDVTWFDNNKNVKVRLDKEAGILTEYKRFNWESSVRASSPVPPRWVSYEQSLELRCFSTDDEESHDFLAVVGKNYQCDMEILCLKLSKHTRSVFSTSKSTLDVMTNDPAVCLKIRYGPRQILFADHIFSTTTVCSSPGIYYSTHSKDCPGRVLIGCHGDMRIIVDRSCDKRTDLFDCTTSWSDKRKIIVAAKKLGIGSLHCFVIGMDSKILHFDEECSGHAEIRETLMYPIFEPCHGSNPAYVLFTPSIIGGTLISVDDDDDEDSQDSSGFHGSREAKNEKHIYLTNENSYVTMEGVWEVMNPNQGSTGRSVNRPPILTFGSILAPLLLRL